MASLHDSKGDATVRSVSTRAAKAVPDLRVEFPGAGKCLLPLARGLRDDFDGDLVFQSGARTGRLFFLHGRIVWVAASTLTESFLGYLVRTTPAGADELRAVLTQCKASGHNFTEAIIARRVLKRDTVRTALLNYVAQALLEIVSWRDVAVRRLRKNRVYTGTISFAPSLVIRAAAAANVELASCLQKFPELAKILHPSFAEGSTQTRISAVPRQAQSAKIDRMRALVARLYDDCGKALHYCDVIRRRDGGSVVDPHAPKAVGTVLAQVCDYLDHSLSESGFPALGRHVVADLADDQFLVVSTGVGDDHLLTMVCDGAGLSLGMLLNCFLPEALEETLR